MPSQEDGKFSEAGYRALIDALRQRGYRFVGFLDVEPELPHAVLRHDIDISIAAAVRMARLESEIGIASHYFVLLRTELYNPLSREGLAGLHEIASLGHQIGLHFDASLYDSERKALDIAAANEISMMEGALGRKIGMISFHRPASSLVGDAAPLAGRPHSYQPRFTSEIGYCSDSRGEWRHGHPLDHPAVQRKRALQLLTHPIWWMGSSGVSQEKLERYLDLRFEELERCVSENCDIYQPRAMRS